MKITINLILFLLPLAVMASPKAEVVGPAQANLGEFDACETRTTTFTIRNAGDAPLKFPCIRKTCGCFQLACDKAEVKPGESAVFTVSVIKESILRTFDKHIFVETNDPGNAVCHFQVSGTAKPLVETLPQAAIRAGRIPAKLDWKQEFLLKPLRPGVRLGAPKAEGDAAFPVTMVEEKGAGWRVCFKLPPKPAPGRFRYQVRVPVEEPKGWKDIELMVSGEVVP